MDVWILVERMDQSDYTEPHYFSSASDSCEIKGVFDTQEKAEEEKARLETLAMENAEELDADPCYYVVLPYTVK